jgi:hypothetical protein
MNWTDNKILLFQDRNTPCKDIFQAVCDELAKYYLDKGFKYARSRPKLTYKDNEIKLEIKFFSSASNTPGEWVCFDFFPDFSSVELEKNSYPKPYILGPSTIMTKIGDWKDKKLIITETAFGERINHFDDYSEEPLFRYSNHCNVYGINKEKFDLLVTFIDSKIICWIEKAKTKEGILEVIKNRNSQTNWELDNSGLKEYAKRKFDFEF